MTLAQLIQNKVILNIYITEYIPIIQLERIIFAKIGEMRRRYHLLGINCAHFINSFQVHTILEMICQGNISREIATGLSFLSLTCWDQFLFTCKNLNSAYKIVSALGLEFHEVNPKITSAN